MPRHQADAEVRIPLASRAMNAPCHEESARIRGCPRLPNPAIRRFNWYWRQGGGKDSSISFLVSCGGFEVRGGHCCIFAQNRTGSRSLPVARNKRSEERRVGKECRSRWSP